MNRIVAILLTLAAALLAIPAVVIGAIWYAGVVLTVLVAGYAVLRAVPQSGAADVLLASNSVISLFALLVGVNPVFPVVALCLYLYAWNTGHRLGHTRRATADPDAERSLIASTLARSIVPSLAIGLLLTASLYVQFPLTHGLGLALSVAALSLIAGFIRLAYAHYRGRD